jgi:Rrf2 family cysteine metabolism transcriptional repressor
MVNITCEKRYALRAVFELAKRDGKGPVKGADIARAQAIPVRFLEVILNKLKRIGLVKSKRGYQGGYTLGRSPQEITVGSVFEPLGFSSCASDSMHCDERKECPFSGGCAFMTLWEEVRTSINDVYHRTTIQDLLEDSVSSMGIN